MKIALNTMTDASLRDTVIDYETVNRFRKARGKLLANYIHNLAASYGRDITVLDIGGRAEYWTNVGTKNISKIIVLNSAAHELARIHPQTHLFQPEVGDARDLRNYPDKSVDLVHSNSVIEHVGDWSSMTAFADEALRVGMSGWVQTPAFEFPIEPHFKLPLAHWLPAPLRRKYLRLSPGYQSANVAERRGHVDRINLLTRKEVKALFPHQEIEIITERFALLPKSYVVRW